ncbi:MAG: uridylate kinase [Archaeoglobus sp.]|nr:uridylate kinase [Archaeoglobus sp.]
MWVVKLGGSVSEKWGEIIKLLLELSDLNSDSNHNFLIIPGGGKLADYVRKLKCDDENAHWMAIAAMEMNAYYIASMGVRKLMPENFSEIEVSGVNVLLPYNLLLKNDELPHSWDVTSDSIAIWVAGKLKAKVIKVTDVDGIIIDGKLAEEINVSDLTFETCLDKYSPQLIKKFGVSVFICNGNYPERVKDYILREKALGTLVKV